MRVRIEMIVDVPDDYDYGCVEQFIDDAIMTLAFDQDEDVDVMEFVDIAEV